MPTITAPEIRAKAISEVRNAAVDFSGRLDSGELLTGTPTVTESTFTATNIAVNTSALTINGATVAIGKAVQFKVPTGGTAGTTYTFQVACGTTSTPAQTLRALVKMLAVADS